MQNLHEENASPMNVSNTSTPSMVVVDPQDLVGHTFLMDECNDGQCFHVKIVECILRSQVRPSPIFGVQRFVQ